MYFPLHHLNRHMMPGLFLFCHIKIDQWVWMSSANPTIIKFPISFTQCFSSHLITMLSKRIILLRDTKWWSSNSIIPSLWDRILLQRRTFPHQQFGHPKVTSKKGQNKCPIPSLPWPVFRMSCFPNIFQRRPLNFLPRDFTQCNISDVWWMLIHSSFSFECSNSSIFGQWEEGPST